MRVFEIANARGRKKAAVAVLHYNEQARTAEIDLLPEAAIGRVPAMFNRYLELGERHIDAAWTLRWIQERIPPPSRHNIQGILEALQLDDYDPYALVIASKGVCSQDDFFLREITLEAAGTTREDAPAGEQRYEYAVVSLRQSVGEQIAAARKQRGLTQKELAWRAGIQQCMLSKLERGLCNPTLETLECLAEALGANLQVRFS
ncbi:MAG: helix-turn-helix transcriptional regulator [Coriobacteriia bacterium]|nr:helix-turn-helix transcriptional regulator [Coriobacteriia bacterium]